MQQNTITPAAADVGASLAEAILAVLDNPAAARAAAEHRAAAARLTEEEAEQLRKDREFMQATTAVRAKMKEWEDWRSSEIAALDATRSKLGEDQDIHTVNVDRFNESVRLHNDDLENHDKEKKQLAVQKKAFANEYSELVNKQEDNRKWEKELMQREQALAGAAASIAGRSAKG